MCRARAALAFSLHLCLVAALVRAQSLDGVPERLAGRVLPAAPVYRYKYREWPTEDIEVQLRQFFAILDGDNWYQNHGWDVELPFEPPLPPPEFNDTDDMLLTSTAIYEHVRLSICCHVVTAM